MSTCSPSKLQAAYDELMNLQPHIAQLPERYRPFIDSHVDVAMALLQEVLSEIAQTNAAAQGPVDPETRECGLTQQPASAAPSGDKSDTPRTDAFQELIRSGTGWAEFARQLERELNAARSATGATDTERLDWLERRGALLNMGMRDWPQSTKLTPHVNADQNDSGNRLNHFYGATYREAIDKAMAATDSGSDK